MKISEMFSPMISCRVSEAVPCEQFRLDLPIRVAISHGNTRDPFVNSIFHLPVILL
jgi:hypothetical protein